MKIHLEAMIVQVWRCTWRPRLSEFGYTLVGWDRARLEADNGWPAKHRDSIHQLADSQPWDCDKVNSPLSSDGELAEGGRSGREARRKLKLHSGVNS